MFIVHIFFLVEVEGSNYCKVRGVANNPLFLAAFGPVHGYYLKRTYIGANKRLNLDVIYINLKVFLYSEVKIINSCKVSGLTNMPLFV